MHPPSGIPTFRNAALLVQALTHRSYLHEHPGPGEHNERLEFLGDALLTFLSGEFLYNRYPHSPEGELTALRSALVDEPQLAQFAQQLKLGQALRLGKGAEQQGGRQNPNLLSCAFEAVVGAYFLDQNSNIEAVRAWVLPWLAAIVDSKISQTGDQLNPKSQLQIAALQRHQGLPEYRIVAESGPDHAKQFTAEVWLAGHCLGRGQGQRKQTAEKAAARAALEQWQ